MFARFFFKQKCPHCQEILIPLGTEPQYAKHFHYYCDNPNCSHKRQVLNYKNDKYGSDLQLKVLVHEKSQAYLLNLITTEQYWVEYE